MTSSSLALPYFCTILVGILSELFCAISAKVKHCGELFGRFFWCRGDLGVLSCHRNCQWNDLETRDSWLCERQLMAGSPLHNDRVKARSSVILIVRRRTRRMIDFSDVTTSSLSSVSTHSQYEF